MFCTALGAGLLLWAGAWVKYTQPAAGGLADIRRYPVTTASTLVQFAVALAFVVTGALCFADSRHARRWLHVGSICLLLEMPLVLLGIFELARAGR